MTSKHPKISVDVSAQARAAMYTLLAKLLLSPFERRGDGRLEADANRLLSTIRSQLPYAFPCEGLVAALDRAAELPRGVLAQRYSALFLARDPAVDHWLFGGNARDTEQWRALYLRVGFQAETSVGIEPGHLCVRLACAGAVLEHRAKSEAGMAGDPAEVLSSLFAEQPRVVPDRIADDALFGPIAQALMEFLRRDASWRRGSA